MLKETLISFESGHYKKVIGEWKGDSVWAHFINESGSHVHVNKDKVEYIETRYISLLNVVLNSFFCNY